MTDLLIFAFICQFRSRNKRKDTFIDKYTNFNHVYYINFILTYWEIIDKSPVNMNKQDGDSCRRNR